MKVRPFQVTKVGKELLSGPLVNILNIQWIIYSARCQWERGKFNSYIYLAVGSYFLLDSDSDLFILITLNIDIIISRAVTDISMLLIKIMQEQL